MLIGIAGDIARASAKVKSELPGRGTEAKREGEKWASEAGSKLDSAVCPLVLLQHPIPSNPFPQTRN